MIPTLAYAEGEFDDIKSSETTLARADTAEIG